MPRDCLFLHPQLRRLLDGFSADSLFSDMIFFSTWLGVLITNLHFYYQKALADSKSLNFLWEKSVHQCFEVKNFLNMWTPETDFTAFLTIQETHELDVANTFCPPYDNSHKAEIIRTHYLNNWDQNCKLPLLSLCFHFLNLQLYFCVCVYAQLFGLWRMTELTWMYKARQSYSCLYMDQGGWHIYFPHILIFESLVSINQARTI